MKTSQIIYMYAVLRSRRAALTEETPLYEDIETAEEVAMEENTFVVEIAFVETGARRVVADYRPEKQETAS